MLDEARLKYMTGEDALVGNRMARDPVEFEATHKVTMAVNHLPEVHDTGDAFWDRIIRLPFSYRIQIVDGDIHKKLADELPGILSWAIKGFADWKKRGLDIPHEINASTLAYRRSADLLRTFIDTFFDRDTSRTGRVERDRIRGMYEGWCLEHGHRAWSVKEFNERMGELGFDLRRGAKIYYWSGLREKPAPSDTPDTPSESGGPESCSSSPSPDSLAAD